MASPTLQLSLPAFQLCPPPQLISPYWFSPYSPAVHAGGGTYYYGKYTCLATKHPIHP